MDWSTSSRAAQHLGVMSDSGEQNYGERVRRGGGGGGCVVPASFVFPGPSASERRWAIWAAKSGQQDGSQFKRPSRVVSLVMKEAPGRLLCSRTRVGRFFRYEGGIKNGRCVPLVLGEGRGIISPLLSYEGSPQPSWAGGLGAPPEAQNGG